MKQLLLAIPAMMEEVLKKVEQEDLNASDERKKETKKLLSNLRKITTEMKDIAESHDKVSQQGLFKMLGDIKNLQGMMPEVNGGQLEKLKEMSPELGGLLELKGSLAGLPDINEAMRFLSPVKQVKEIKSLKEGSVEKSTKSQPKADRIDPTENKD